MRCRTPERDISKLTNFSLATPATLNPVLAISCLESVPLHVEEALDFIDYISPFIESQATLAYLKDQPVGYLMAGVDVLGGLQEIRTKVKNITYNNQYEFEKELYILVNILPRDFHFNLLMPLINLFTFSMPSDASMVSNSSDGEALPELYLWYDMIAADAAKLGNIPVLTWTPSSVVSINGQCAEDYVLFAGLETLQVVTLSSTWYNRSLISVQYADPDAVYNMILWTPAPSPSKEVTLGTMGVTCSVFHQQQQHMSLATRPQSALKIEQQLQATLPVSPTEKSYSRSLRFQPLPLLM